MPQKTVPVSFLKDHPRQREVFGVPSPEEIERLAASINRRGLDYPLEILPDGTIIKGHRRRLAAQSLGWKDVPVKILHELADDPVAASRLFLSDNFDRQQLTPLRRAKCIVSLMELEIGKLVERFNANKKEQLKESVAKQLHTSRRTVDRYLLALRTPFEVQEAFDRNKLSLVQVGKIAMMSKAVQNAIAARLALGEPPRVVYADTVEDTSPYKAIASLLVAVNKARDVIGDQVLDNAKLQKYRGRLRVARGYIDGLIKGQAC